MNPFKTIFETHPAIFFAEKTAWLLFWKIFPANSRHRWDHSLVSSKLVRSKLMSSSGLPKGGKKNLRYGSGSFNRCEDAPLIEGDPPPSSPPLFFKVFHIPSIKHCQQQINQVQSELQICLVGTGIRYRFSSFEAGSLKNGYLSTFRTIPQNENLQDFKSMVVSGFCKRW